MKSVTENQMLFATEIEHLTNMRRIRIIDQRKGRSEDSNSYPRGAIHLYHAISKKKNSFKFKSQRIRMIFKLATKKGRPTWGSNPRP
jgi:hypothetical protein